MSKPEWGTKRLCLGCGAKFYDMRHHPIRCPKCGAIFDLESLNKPRRTRAAPVAAEPKAAKPVAKKPAPEAAVQAGAEALEGDVDIELETDKDEEEEIIEDASELGEDEDDVAEVIDGVSKEEP